MTDKKDGDPTAVRHLRPKNMPHHTEVNVPAGPPGDSARESLDLLEGEVGLIEEIEQYLERLRAPFPPEEIEKRPQPKWKDAWDNEPKGRCDDCGGYHVLVNTIHLEYVGHAGVTRRLLQVDPMWNWRPLARDEHGLPLFDRFGGLWIKLTICGVTRLGYGDAVGKQAGTTAVKEIIGDAIRNAAMRFGVALELWSKIDRHEGKNPGATDDTSSQQRRPSQRTGDQNSGRSSRSDGGKGRVPNQRGQANTARQDALDEVTSICDAHGYSYQYATDRFESDYDIKPADATPEQLREFGEVLVAEATAEPDGGSTTEGDGAVTEGGEATALGGDSGGADAAQSDRESSDDQGGSVGQVAPAESDADVEKQPGDLF